MVVVGTFMPALDMNGVSLTLLKASGEGAATLLDRWVTLCLSDDRSRLCIDF
jgi:dihydroxyacetone kinase